jgi:hypothetical protein
MAPSEKKKKAAPPQKESKSVKRKREVEEIDKLEQAVKDLVSSRGRLPANRSRTY